MNFEKIKNDKIQEAKELYKILGIEIKDEELPVLDYYPTLDEIQRNEEIEKEVEFHWTRLSINSNIGYIAE